MHKFVVVGTSGHANVVIDALEARDDSEVVGLIDSFRAVGERAYGYEVLGDEHALGEVIAAHGANACVVAIGDNAVRRRVVDAVRAACDEVVFRAVVHPSVIIGRGTVVGDGAVLLPGAVVGPSCRVGAHSIINTRASLDHDSVLGEFASLAPGVATGGNVEVGACSAVGVGAAINHGVRVGEHTVVGSGAAVVRDVPSFSVAVGVPARVIRSRAAGERYL